MYETQLIINNQIIEIIFFYKTLHINLYLYLVIICYIIVKT
jgi:hypothetical protein